MQEMQNKNIFSNNEQEYNVLFRDGERIVNWDFKASTTVREALKHFRFHFRPNTVIVNSMHVPDDKLDLTLQSLMTASRVRKTLDKRFPDRLKITMIGIPTPRKKQAAESEEDDNDVC